MKFLQKLKLTFDRWLRKYINPNSMLFLVLITISGILPAEERKTYTETIQKTAHFENAAYDGNSLNVYNINGNVSVEEHSGNSVQITAEKKISASRQMDIERGIKEMTLVVDESGDQILIYLDAPFIQHYKSVKGISYNINTSRDEIGYEFLFDISMKVPRNTRVYASTINGDVQVLQVNSSEITAKTVNGNLNLVNVAGKITATTVNGNITASHREKPSEVCRYKTINGQIEASYPQDLSANILFSSLHGDLFTDFKDVQRSSSLINTDKSQGYGTRLQVNKSSPFRIGEGETELHFNVLNGNVYIKNINN